MKKIITKILIFILLFIPVFQTKAWLAELEPQLSPWVWTFLKSFVSSNLWKLDFLKKVVEIINRDLNKYTPKQQVALTYFKLLIEAAVNWNSWWTWVVTWNIPVPKVNNWKIPFNWKYVKVDSLWNVQINEWWTWKPFFPICIYWATYWNWWVPSKLNLYKSYWFNCVIKTKINQESLNAIKAAWMKLILQTWLSAWEFKPKIELLKNNNFATLLFYYSDNEWSNRSAYDWHKEKKWIINQYDPNWHPIYFLNWVPGDALKQDQNWRVSDITWSYVYERRYSEAENWPTKIITLEKNWTKQPVVMAQLNFWVWWDNGDSNASTEPIWRKMTPLAMASVAVWARWLGYWRDWFASWPNKRTPVENVWFWNDLRKFKADIDKLMAMWIIQQQDNPFKASCWQSDSKDVQIWAWTRKLNGEWYVILSNWNNAARNIRCSIEWLWYTPRSLLDVLSWWNWWTVSWNSISVQVPAYHRRVVKLVK